MRRFDLLCLSFAVLLASPPPAQGDGGYFYYFGNPTADLTQTRQEVVLVYQQAAPDAELFKVTYVLRSRYAGAPTELAWVIPVPATPTDVVAHKTGALFESLAEHARPRFVIRFGAPGGGLGCAAGSAPETTSGGLVQVESRGTAGIFEWAALTSSGGDALMDWLNENQFAVGQDAAAILNDYIQAGSHFLAVRVKEPAELTGDENGEIEIPPIQFACETASRSYPMVISRISAAEETEVTIYTLARHRMEGSNVANATIDPDAVSYDASTSSQTNYEALFRDKIASYGGLALITEFAGPTENEMFWRAADWPDAPPGAADLQFLTRMRTVVARERLERDFQFRDADEDAAVSSVFRVQAEPQQAAGAVGYLLAVGLGLGAARVAFRNGKRGNAESRNKKGTKGTNPQMAQRGTDKTSLCVNL